MSPVGAGAAAPPPGSTLLAGLAFGGKSKIEEPGRLRTLSPRRAEPQELSGAPPRRTSLFPQPRLPPRRIREALPTVYAGLDRTTDPCQGKRLVLCVQRRDGLIARRKFAAVARGRREKELVALPARESPSKCAAEDFRRAVVLLEAPPQMSPLASLRKLVALRQKPSNKRIR